MSASVASRTPTVAIVGAGMSGLCMGIRLQRAGIDSFTIYEKAASVGGTWRENTYPGLACDVPSRFYQYSFEINPDWTHVFSPGPEIWDYFEQVTDRYALRSKIAFNKEIVDAQFEDGRWRIRTQDGDESVVDFLISATGVLHHPRRPRFEGAETFEGAIFHSARWEHGVALGGKRVAVIGTGSTGVQIVTGVAGTAARVLHFQRTPQWILPAPNRRYSKLARALHRRFPALSRAGYRVIETALALTFSRAVIQSGWQRRAISWLCRANLRTVRDRELRRKLTPAYEPMCKRLVVSSGFYRAVQRDDVEVVAEGIDRLEPKGIVTADGRLYEVDVIVLATGFDAHAYVRPLALTGPDGRTLEEAWSEGPRAHRTVALAGFPNFFMLMGPHSPVGNYSLIAIAEDQVRFVMNWIEQWRRREFDTVAPSEDAQERFNASMRAAMPGTVWITGCDSWYIGKDGLPETWPWTPEAHRRMMRKPRREEYELTRGVLVPS